MKYILALDQGTTSSRAILFDQAGKSVAEEEDVAARAAHIEADRGKVAALLGDRR